jgi:hypothetical protein
VSGVADQALPTTRAASGEAMTQATSAGQKAKVEPKSVRNKPKAARHKRRHRG